MWLVSGQLLVLNVKISIDLSSSATDLEWMNNFRNQVVPRVRGDPFYCNTPDCLANDGKNVRFPLQYPLTFFIFQPGGFARHLHDAFFMYGLTLTNAISKNPIDGYKDPDLLVDGVQVRFMGIFSL